MEEEQYLAAMCMVQFVNDIFMLVMNVIMGLVSLDMYAIIS